MLCDFSSGITSRQAVIALFLMQSVIAHAEPVLAAADDGQAAGVQAAGVRAVDDKGAAETPAVKDRQPYVFPSWPERHVVKHERVPPPPPGPYMSSALSGASFSAPVPERDHSPAGSKSAIKPLAAPGAPMQDFSPDSPWPSNNMGRSPNRWKPENGYHFVSPAKKIPDPVMPAKYYPGNRYPMMNWPGSGANNMPFMGPSAGMSPGRPYPARNGNYTQRVQPQSPNRAPYSSYGRP